LFFVRGPATPGPTRRSRASFYRGPRNPSAPPRVPRRRAEAEHRGRAGPLSGCTAPRGCLKGCGEMAALGRKRGPGRDRGEASPSAEGPSREGGLGRPGPTGLGTRGPGGGTGSGWRPWGGGTGPGWWS